MMVYAYVHRITEFGENEPSVQKSVFKRLRVEHCRLTAPQGGSRVSEWGQSWARGKRAKFC